MVFLSIIDLLFSIIITITIYSLPIIIYRYAVKKSPLPPSKAKLITIVYGIAAFIVMFFIKFLLGDGKMSGGAIFFWSFINYKMLSGNYKSEEQIDTSLVKIKIFDEQKGIYEKTESKTKLPLTYTQYLDEYGTLYAVSEHFEGNDRIKLISEEEWDKTVYQHTKADKEKRIVIISCIILAVITVCAVIASYFYQQSLL